MRSLIRSVFLFALLASAHALPGKKKHSKGHHEKGHKKEEASQTGTPNPLQGAQGLVAPEPDPKTGDTPPVTSGLGPDGKLSLNLIRDMETLQNWAKTVTVDKNHTMASWTGDDPCKFKGVECAIHPKGYIAVAAIRFNGFHLGDDIDLHGLLDKLPDLAGFYVNSNNFTGGVPHIGQLPTLWELDLSNNNLSGSFPETVFEGNLTWLELRYNNFYGELPPQIFQVTDFDALILNNNSFSGNIPPFGDIGLIVLQLGGNNFTGPIPPGLEKVRGIREIALMDNQLTGTIPEELCAVKTLTVLDVSGNNMDTSNLGPNCQALLKSKVLHI